MLNYTYDLLVVEDEPVVLSSIRKIIDLERLRMDEALNGDIALSKLKRQTYRLIITDLMLPRISGLSLIRSIKQIHPCIPLIVITGYATLEKALQSFQAGSFDFIPKPFDTEAFLGVVSRGLNYSRLMEGRGPEDHVYLPVSEPGDLEKNDDIIYCLGCHSQAKLQEDGSALIRVGETFSGTMDHLSQVEFVAGQDEIVQGKCCAQFITEEGKINMLWAPLSGKIEAQNSALAQNIHWIDTAPFDKGWIFKITPSDLDAELKHLRMCRKGSYLPRTDGF